VIGTDFTGRCNPTTIRSWPWQHLEWKVIGALTNCGLQTMLIYRHDMAQILLKVALNTITLTLSTHQSWVNGQRSPLFLLLLKKDWILANQNLCGIMEIYVNRLSVTHSWPSSNYSSLVIHRVNRQRNPCNHVIIGKHYDKSQWLSL
jgi:hypothetical protein